MSNRIDVRDVEPDWDRMTCELFMLERQARSLPKKSPERKAVAKEIKQLHRHRARVVNEVYRLRAGAPEVTP